MTTDHVYVLDLHDSTGTTGYRMEWNVKTGEFSVHICEGGRLTCCEHTQSADQRQVEYMLTTAFSVATAVRDDHVMGFLRDAFCDGYAKVNDLGLEMGFDLENPKSNETITCSLFRNCPETGEVLEDVQFNMTLQALEDSVRGIEPIVLHKHWN